MTGIQIAWEDVFSVIGQISGWLIGIGVTLVALILVLIFAGKAGKQNAGFVRAQGAIAAVLVITLLVNLGPLRDGHPDRGDDPDLPRDGGRGHERGHRPAGK